MPTYLSKWSWTTRLSLIVLIVGVLGAVMLPRPRVGLALFASGLFGLAVARSGHELRVLLKASARTWVRWEARARRMVPVARAAFMEPPIIGFAWYVAVYAVLATLAFLIVDADGPGWTLFNSAIVFVIVVAMADVAWLARRFFSWAWTTSLGKVALGFATAIVASLSLSWSRSVVFALTNEDPGKAPTSVALFASLLGPLAWVNVLALLGAITFMPVLLAALFRITSKSSDDTPRRSLIRSFRNGLRPAFLSLSPLAALIYLTTGGVPSNRWVRAAATVVIVHMDYFETSACGDRVDKANRLDGRRVSVASTKEGWPELNTRTCPDPRRRQRSLSRSDGPVGP